MRYETRSLAMPGAELTQSDVSALREMSLQISGITQSALALQATLDGETWTTLIASPIANGITALSLKSAAALRLTGTVHTAEEPVVVVGGFNTRSV